MVMNVLSDGMELYGHLKQLVEHDSLNTIEVTKARQHLMVLQNQIFEEPTLLSESHFFSGLASNITSMLDEKGHQEIFWQVITENGKFQSFKISGRDMVKMRAENLAQYNGYQDNAFIYQGKPIDGSTALSLLEKS